jgi:hypothetical protein
MYGFGKGGDHDLFLGTILAFSGRNSEKPRQNLIVRLVCNQTEIQTAYFRNTSLELYHYTNLIDSYSYSE